MNIFLMSGLPCSGKTTTGATLLKYIKDNGMTAVSISTSSTRGRREDLIHAICGDLYQAIVEKQASNIIVEGPFLNVYDREKLLKRIDAAYDVISENNKFDINVIAIQHNRSNRFIFEHNGTEDEPTYSDRAIIRATNIYQQAIRDEGFDFIYAVNGNRYVDMNKVAAAVNKLDYTFAYNEEKDNVKEATEA